jgi:hypothetical protein
MLFDDPLNLSMLALRFISFTAGLMNVSPLLRSTNQKLPNVHKLDLEAVASNAIFSAVGSALTI